MYLFFTHFFCLSFAHLAACHPFPLLLGTVFPLLLVLLGLCAGVGGYTPTWGIPGVTRPAGPAGRRSCECA